MGWPFKMVYSAILSGKDDAVLNQWQPFGF